MTISLEPVGFIRSPLKRRTDAPKQGGEGAPDAWLELNSDVEEGLEGVAVGQELVLLTGFHDSRRDVLRVHPRWDKHLPLTGVFLTRSPDRPNPIGLHRVTVREVDGNQVKVGPLEALDGTPVVDIKPAISNRADSCAGGIESGPTCRTTTYDRTFQAREWRPMPDLTPLRLLLVTSRGPIDDRQDVEGPRDPSRSHQTVRHRGARF